MTKVAIVGASGYAALELIKIILRHPNAQLAMATSRQDEEPRLDRVHPSLRSRVDLSCVRFSADRVAESANIAFLALPHAASMEAAVELRARDVRVIDLSADYRIKDAAVYQDWYDHTHTDPVGLAEAVYGLPELFRSQIPGANLIANPGCYTSASILALAPLLAEDMIDPTNIVIDAKSGVSGAGRSPKLTTHYPECNESLSAYGVGRHRHTPEIDQILSTVAGRSVEVLFTPHLVPMTRGLMATVYASPLRGPVVEHDLMSLYRHFYKDSPFVRVTEHLPATGDSVHTNFCDLTIRVVKGRIMVISCLDNLIKGAAGAAVQNMNLMLGLDETLGLL